MLWIFYTPDLKLYLFIYSEDMATDSLLTMDFFQVVSPRVTTGCELLCQSEFSAVSKRNRFRYLKPTDIWLKKYWAQKLSWADGEPGLEAVWLGAPFPHPLQIAPRPLRPRTPGAGHSQVQVLLQPQALPPVAPGHSPASLTGTDLLHLFTHSLLTQGVAWLHMTGGVQVICPFWTGQGAGKVATCIFSLWAGRGTLPFKTGDAEDLRKGVGSVRTLRATVVSYPTTSSLDTGLISPLSWEVQKGVVPNLVIQPQKMLLKMQVSSVCLFHHSQSTGLHL